MEKISILSAVEVMRIFGISRATLFRWHESGFLRKRHVGRRVYYYESDVRSLLEKGEKDNEKC